MRFVSETSHKSSTREPRDKNLDREPRDKSFKHNVVVDSAKTADRSSSKSITQ